MADIRPETVNVKITDVGTAETICIPVTPNLAGEIRTISHCLGAAISGADSNIIISKNATALGTITVANSSSAAGDIDTLTLNNVYVKVGDYIKIANGGESTGPAVGVITIDIVR